MFVEGMGPNQKGAMAEIAIANEAARLGCGVYWPLVEHGRCDLVLEIEGRTFRLQCKWAGVRNNVVEVRLATSRYTPRNGYVRTQYSADEIDAVAVYCGELDRYFLIPIQEADGRSGFHLRLGPPRNNQEVAVNYAADYEFHGAVAQLARAIGWQPVGRGFESLQLHSESEVVGAEEFGLHAPRYVQRAKAGESFLITRRGKPMAGLVPPDALGAIQPADGAGDDDDLAQPTLLEEPPDAEAA